MVMQHSRWFCVRLAGLLAVAGGVLSTAEPTLAGGPRFGVTFDQSVSPEPYSGRVFIVLTTRADRTPLDALEWFDPQPFFGQDVENWRPGQVLRFDPARCLGAPCELDKLPAGTYYGQAVIDLNGESWNPIRAPGNGISTAVKFTHDPDSPAGVALKITKRLPALNLRDTDDVKYVRIKSKLLSEFHKKDVYLQAAVGLPEEYHEEQQRRFPTVYIIPGFTGTMRGSPQYLMMMMGLNASVGFEAVTVYLDADCATGHHVFADSANNGPVGSALVGELIPHLEAKFRLIPQPCGRYVTGMSSGGWSSLWLQITYPEVFGGVWSWSPDPVDFTAFMVVNIYDSNENLLYDKDGAAREFSRAGMFGQPIVAKDFIRMEQVVGRGGQFYSFDAVFSPRGPDGKPLFAWDRTTGKINPRVAETWKKYDIRRIIESRWQTLGPKLRGKLYLYCGSKDDFFLDRAFYKLRDTLRSLGSDAYIEVVPDGGHTLSPMKWVAGARQMKEHFDQHGPRSEGE